MNNDNIPGENRPQETLRDVISTLEPLLKNLPIDEIEYTYCNARIHIRMKTSQVPAIHNPEVAAVHTPNSAAVPVLSPLVGTVYLAPKPDAAPFVKVGDMVQKGQTLLIIEAMKVMNHVNASLSGRVVSINVSNGSAVEFEEELLHIDPSLGASS